MPETLVRCGGKYDDEQKAFKGFWGDEDSSAEAGSRPRGVGKSKLDAYQAEITALLKNGATKTWIANTYGATRRNLSHWMKQHQIR